MSDVEEYFHQSCIHHDDSTHTYLFFSLDVGFIQIEHLTLVEAFNFTVDVGAAGGDWASVLVKWAEGYRDSDLYGVDVIVGDDWEADLSREILRLWPDN